MNQEEFLMLVDAAINEVYESDRQLIDQNTSERAIAHRLAVYLENSHVLDEWDIDCEYNRYGKSLDPKKLPSIEDCKERRKRENTTDWIIPDILIHVRQSEDKDNLAVFEIKSLKPLDDCDQKKLRGMTVNDGDFKYELGIGVEFYNDYYNRLLIIDGEIRECKKVVATRAA